ncbi:MAG TPA: hypothetical protein VN449_06025 [Gaiellaceae bacterium]|nr:hypothetical protein [Gaiellaceae bacterium]
MHTVLDFIGLAFYVVLVVALAAGATWLVVRISPTKDKKAAREARS